MVAFDLLGRRWSLRILWELRTGPAGFRPLQALCDGMSSSVLRQRLLELTEHELVRQAEDGAYELTTMGLELGNAIRPLDQWAQRWVERPGVSSGPGGKTIT
jgi:DNA-binding HxlR family transcriptional regulator